MFDYLMFTWMMLIEKAHYTWPLYCFYSSIQLTLSFETAMYIDNQTWKKKKK